MPLGTSSEIFSVVSCLHLTPIECNMRTEMNLRNLRYRSDTLRDPLRISYDER